MIARLVLLGLAAAAGASAVGGLPAGPLPGVALGSGPLLIVERAVAFFAAWMVCLVIVAQALRGRLPVEISGRGVRYAPASTVEATKDEAEDAVRHLTSAIDRLRFELLAAERPRKEID
jgi:hypothetical protein